MRMFAEREKGANSPMPSRLAIRRQTAFPERPTAASLSSSGHDFSRISVHPIQAKLEVSAPGDKFEQEADQVADAVLGRQTIQRKCAECEEEEAEADGQGEELEMDGQGGLASASVSQRIEATRGSGSQLPDATSRELGSRMGADFSDVRIHSDAGAAGMCRELRAHAFTVGNDIYFNHNRYDPGSSAGLHLLTHELTHTLQQASPIRRLSITPTKTFSQGACGEREVFWNFESGVAAPASGGYIVQHLRNLETCETCPNDVRAVEIQPKDEFWEAWWVAAGDTIQELHKNGTVEYTDRSARPAKDGAGRTCHQASLGTVKFFGKNTTGDLGKEDVLSSDPAIRADWKPGTKGGVPKSGWLPSTRKKPSWWDKQLDGPASRWANSWWNCCGEDESKHWSKSDASPR